MHKIQLWADGYVSYYGWGEECAKCGGNIFPNRRPDPDENCEICCGMGGSPLNLCPMVSFGADVYSQLVILGCGRMVPLTGKITPRALFRAIREIESTLRDHPEAEDAAWVIHDLKKRC